jgi:hypothetical protein
MTLPRNGEEAIQQSQQYDMIYVQLGYLYTILTYSPLSRSGDFSTLGESHVVDGLIISMSHTYPNPTPLKPSGYGKPYRGVNTSYEYINPSQDLSHSSYQVSTSTSYPTPNAHPHVHGSTCKNSSYGRTSMNLCYPFLSHHQLL